MTRSTLRLRVFAGPNGSGKSTIINAVRAYQVKGIPVDFGLYVNADEIARALRQGQFDFGDFELEPTRQEFTRTALDSGLIHKGFTEVELQTCYSLENSKLTLLQPAYDERLAQVIADFLRKALLQARKKFSFETVFSHTSKLDIMRQAVQAGYKVYLYFVSTESPEINKFRVMVREKQGGHSVPPDKIESRYYRSLEYLFEAAQLTHQTFFFDNSTERITEGDPFKPFAHFKVVKGKKEWDPIDEAIVPNWFISYYSQKVSSFGSRKISKYSSNE